MPTGVKFLWQMSKTASPLRRKLNGMGRVQYLKNNALVRLVRVLNAIPKRVLLRWE